MQVSDSMQQLVSPKRRSDGDRSLLPWSQYYAGFSEKFALQVMDQLHVTRDDTILDPWNGSGTTTTVAYGQGIQAIGIDINPVMEVVANARCASNADLTEASESLHHIRERIGASSRKAFEAPLDHEPLLTWFVPRTAAAIRSMVTALRTTPPPSFDLLPTSPADALILLAVFATVRQLMGRFRTSNPTWTRDPRVGESRVFSSEEDILTILEQTCTRFFSEISGKPVLGGEKRTPTLLVASADNLPIQSESVASVITSPPYCTRIDYAVACKPELAVLGLPMGAEFRNMRNSMLGTPTIIKGTRIAPRSDWGVTCLSVLNAVKAHQSKASSSYYIATLLQYFDQLFRSLAEAIRVLKKGGMIVIVLQDSFYKEVHIDLARIVEEMCSWLGAVPKTKQDFPAPVSMRSVNSRSRGYNGRTTAIESVLVIKKL